MFKTKEDMRNQFYLMGSLLILKAVVTKFRLSYSLLSSLLHLKPEQR